MNLKGISCVLCGRRVYNVPALEPGGASGLADAGWYCPDHRASMKSLLGESSGMSPGRPVTRPTETERARALYTGRRRHRSQAPAPPRMARPSSGRPNGGGPGMPHPRP